MACNISNLARHTRIAWIDVTNFYKRHSIHIPIYKALVWDPSKWWLERAPVWELYIDMGLDINDSWSQKLRGQFHESNTWTWALLPDYSYLPQRFSPGLFFYDHKRSFNKHVDFLVTKCSSRLFLMRKLLRLLV